MNNLSCCAGSLREAEEVAAEFDTLITRKRTTLSRGARLVIMNSRGYVDMICTGKLRGEGSPVA